MSKKRDREKLDAMVFEHRMALLEQQRRIYKLERIVEVPSFSFNALQERVLVLEQQHFQLVGDMRRLVEALELHQVQVHGKDTA